MLRVKNDEVAYNLLVSSEVMSIASPVFAAMFDGRFAEGQDLSSEAPREVDLPDDDPELVKLLCEIVHLKVTLTRFGAIAPVLGYIC